MDTQHAFESGLLESFPVKSTVNHKPQRPAFFRRLQMAAQGSTSFSGIVPGAENLSHVQTPAMKGHAPFSEPWNLDFYLLACLSQKQWSQSTGGEEARCNHEGSWLDQERWGGQSSSTSGWLSKLWSLFGYLKY